MNQPNAVVSGGKGLEHQLYYTCRLGIKNSHRVEAGMLDRSLYVRKFNTVCNFCGEIVGWHLTAKSDDIPTGVYWCHTLMDRERVVLLDEEENEIARDCNVDSELPSINYLKENKAKKAKKVLPPGITLTRPRKCPWEKVLPQERAARQAVAQGTPFKPACERPWSYFA
ncbi:hypothetical protein MKX03_001603 [Papaver bracteatum]|nr:hypothetical protein MKX03_001603 [Papaver bracteatum]